MTPINGKEGVGPVKDTHWEMTWTEVCDWRKERGKEYDCVVEEIGNLINNYLSRARMFAEKNEVSARLRDHLPRAYFKTQLRQIIMQARWKNPWYVASIFSHRIRILL